MQLETVTPLFLGGADPRGKPELRAASVRGALRFWLRALAGSSTGDSASGIEKLRQMEAQVFGSTDTGASPISIQLKHRNPLETIGYSQLAELDIQNNPRNTGIAYLFFAARSDRSNPERKAIKAGTSFNLHLLPRPGIDAKSALQQSYAALWLLTHLGGLGARSRRGAGSIQVTRSVMENDWFSDLPGLVVQAKTPCELKEELEQGLRTIRTLLSGKAQIQRPSTFDILHPGVCQVIVIDKTFNTWGDALDWLGQEMRNFRSRRQPDYSNAKSAIQAFKPLSTTIERAAFGLPIAFYFRSLNKKATLQGSSHDRRASPLLIRVTRLSNGKCVLVLTLFYANLLQHSERLKFNYQPEPNDGAVPPDFSLVDKFLYDIQSKGAACLKVTAW
ncbi:MAG: type III-B CRISPR module RAMP protein Cmr1 [Anaerolineales bacterium]|nr:type III-B CRISPR module RAMP protein Cmr1 [Anaerolineales bacterium]